MSLENFQLNIMNHLIELSKKRDFTKMYIQQGDQLNQADQNTEIIFFENINYHKSVMLI